MAGRVGQCDKEVSSQTYARGYVRQTLFLGLKITGGQI